MPVLLFSLLNATSHQTLLPVPSAAVGTVPLGPINNDLVKIVCILCTQLKGGGDVTVFLFFFFPCDDSTLLWDKLLF